MDIVHFNALRGRVDRCFERSVGFNLFENGSALSIYLRLHGHMRSICLLRAENHLQIIYIKKTLMSEYTLFTDPCLVT